MLGLVLIPTLSSVYHHSTHTHICKHTYTHCSEMPKKETKDTDTASGKLSIVYCFTLDTVVRILTAVLTVVARFFVIARMIIPGLACTFVVLSITFHITLIAATHMCCVLINLCWWHLCSSGPPKASP